MCSERNLIDIYDLLNQLCNEIAPNKKKEALQYATDKFSDLSQISTLKIVDEDLIVLKIMNFLKTKSPDSVQLFSQIHSAMQESIDLKNYKSILIFLLQVGQANDCNFNMNTDLSKFTTNSIRRVYSRSEIPSSSSSSSEIHIKSDSSQSHILKSNDSNISNSYLTLFPYMDDLIDDVLSAFIGCQGKYLKKEITGGFTLDSKASELNKSHCRMLLRLAELGYYYEQIESFINKGSGRAPHGFLGQGLITALKKERTQYLGLVASLSEQLNHQRKSNNLLNDDHINLTKLMVWTTEPMNRFKWLIEISEACQDKKGGLIASTIYNYIYCGDPTVQQIAKDILSSVCMPLQTLLGKWLLDGEIEDPYSEFFIEILPESGIDRFWHDKYRIRENLLPNFISKKLAKKILVTGKSKNYLREFCHDNTSIKGRDELKQCLISNVENIFSPVEDTKLHLMIDTAYLNTSKKVLDMILGPHKLLEHLQAMRKYLLLGQGDFIGLLMETLKPELDRPGKELDRLTLSCIMTSAIRSTNAQYDDAEILDHLDVKLSQSFEGDTGWDIFALYYTIQGPLSPIFKPTMNKYEMLFKPLWKAKHIEFVSTNIWKEQKYMAKILKPMKKELSRITHQLNLYTHEMIHFIHQMQYYVLFEVLECSWSDFIKKVNNAETLDDILMAHEGFLEIVQVGMFLDDKQKEIACNLDCVYTSIMKLESWQNRFYELCKKENDSRKNYEKFIEESEKKGTFGATIENRLERDNERKLFDYHLTECQINLGIISKDYENYVRNFLLKLASTNDNTLQLFGSRLDFNEYYKKQDQSLGFPLTFEHVRMSSVSRIPSKLQK